MNEDRKLTAPGAKLIQHFEGCLQQKGTKYHAYKCPAGVATIGWGHTNHHGRKFDLTTVWTKDDCDEAFREDMQGFERDVRKAVHVPLTDYQFNSLVSFTYNCGSGNLHKSTLLKLVNQGKFDEASKEFIKWNKAGGKVMAGLTRRRKSEALMFRGLSDENFDGVADDPMPQAVDAPSE
jgi:lysozyme